MKLPSGSAQQRTLALSLVATLHVCVDSVATSVRNPLSPCAVVHVVALHTGDLLNLQPVPLAAGSSAIEHSRAPCASQCAAAAG